MSAVAWVPWAHHEPQKGWEARGRDAVHTTPTPQPARKLHGK